MAGAAGQAAGLAVGAAVGSFTGVGALAGASVGSGLMGYFGQRDAQKAQSTLEAAALRLNQEQARLKAAEASSINAQRFRTALASQVSLASMRGGAGSLVRGFSMAAYQSFLRDEQAISTGLDIAEIQGDIKGAEIGARSEARQQQALTRLASSAFEGINLNLTQRTRDGN